MATQEQIDTAAALFNQARARRDSHYPDAAAAAAEAVPHPGPERDAAQAAIQALWDDATSTRPGSAPPSRSGRVTAATHPPVGAATALGA